MRLNHPINWVASRRGMRLVSRKLMSSWANTRSILVRTVMGLSIPARKPRFDVEGGHTGALRGRRSNAGWLAGATASAPRIVECQASIRRLTRADGAALG